MQVYEAKQEREKLSRKAEYYIATFLKGVFFIVTWVLKALLGIIKNVLRTFGLPVPKN